MNITPFEIMALVGLSVLGIGLIMRVIEIANMVRSLTQQIQELRAENAKLKVELTYQHTGFRSSPA